jgi:uncharacterized protein (DUF1330 family)
MTTYAVAHMREVTIGPAIVEYLERIDATLEPFGGRFIMHGAEPTVVEGEFSGNLIVVAFPTREQAQDWYASPAYRAILPLRTENSSSDVLLVDGVGSDHRATDVLRARASAPPEVAAQG